MHEKYEPENLSKRGHFGELDVDTLLWRNSPNRI